MMKTDQEIKDDFSRLYSKDSAVRGIVAMVRPNSSASYDVDKSVARFNKNVSRRVSRYNDNIRSMAEKSMKNFE